MGMIATHIASWFRERQGTGSSQSWSSTLTIHLISFPSWAAGENTSDTLNKYSQHFEAETTTSPYHRKAAEACQPPTFRPQGQHEKTLLTLQSLKKGIIETDIEFLQTPGIGRHLLLTPATQHLTSSAAGSGGLEVEVPQVTLSRHPS